MVAIIHFDKPKGKCEIKQSIKSITSVTASKPFKINVFFLNNLSELRVDQHNKPKNLVEWCIHVHFDQTIKRN